MATQHQWHQFFSSQFIKLSWQENCRSNLSLEIEFLIRTTALLCCPFLFGKENFAAVLLFKSTIQKSDFIPCLNWSFCCSSKIIKLLKFAIKCLTNVRGTKNVSKVFVLVAVELAVLPMESRWGRLLQWQLLVRRRPQVTFLSVCDDVTL